MRSLRGQLTRALLGALSLLLGAALVGIFLSVRWALLESFDTALRARALAASALTEWESERVQFDFSADFLRSYGADRAHNYFEFWSEAGVPVRRSPSLGSGDLPRAPVAPGERPKFWNLTLPNGKPGRAVGLSFTAMVVDKSGASDPPRLELVVAVDSGEMDETLAWLVGAVVGCGVLLFGAVWFVVPWVLRRGLASVERLGEQASRIDANSLAARFETAELPGELRPIGDRLNDLLARLEASFERERRFSADLAHELRTPLAELRSLAECALKWPDSRDPETDREVVEIAAQMEALVSRMLALARGERSQLAANLAPLVVEALVRETWQAHAARAAARQVRMSMELAPGLAPADPVLLRSILGNLFDNAADYAPAGGEIRLKSEVTATGYRLRLANPAGELTATDVERIFDRFWRKEASRSASGAHVGLGLSLARTFATAMGWRLHATIDAGGWLVFTLESAAK